MNIGMTHLFLKYSIYELNNVNNIICIIIYIVIL